MTAFRPSHCPARPPPNPTGGGGAAGWKRAIARGLTGAASLLLALSAPDLLAAKPNLIVIIADDLGYGDTSVYDGWVETPQLKRMAAEGLTFTDSHGHHFTHPDPGRVIRFMLEHGK